MPGGLLCFLQLRISFSPPLFLRLATPTTFAAENNHIPKGKLVRVFTKKKRRFRSKLCDATRVSTEVYLFLAILSSEGIPFFGYFVFLNDGNAL